MKEDADVVVYDGTKRISETEREAYARKMGNPQWQKGVSGNPNGRPLGARSKFGQDFVKAFAEHWSQFGQRALDRVAEEDPATYVRAAVAILPKVIEVDEETKEIIQAITLIPFNVIRERLTDESEPNTPH